MSAAEVNKVLMVNLVRKSFQSLVSFSCGDGSRVYCFIFARTFSGIFASRYLYTLPDDLMNSIEPYDYSKIVPFDGQYLSGFLADRYDKGPDDSIPTASERMMNSAVKAFSQAAGAESTASSLSLRNNGLKLTDPSVKYVLLPVYIFNCRYAGKIYRFAMNGQTGKLVGELPIDKGKKRLFFWLPFLITAAIVFLIIRFLLMP